MVAVALRFETRQLGGVESASTRSDDGVWKNDVTPVVPVAHTPPEMNRSCTLAATDTDVPATLVQVSAAGCDGR